MKPLSVFCSASLLLNIALIVFVIPRSSAPAISRDPSATTTPAPQPIPLSTKLADHWSELHDNDLATFTRNLRAAGLPHQLVRRIIAAEIDEQFRGREEALRPRRKKLKFWQVDNNHLSMETQLALLDLRREKARLRTQVLGPDPTESENSDDNPIAPAKREMVRLITEDYDTMINAIRGQAGGMLLSAEQEKIKYLQGEKQRELTALLTAEELAAQEMRTSVTTQRIRSQLRNFDASDSEFAAIYAAQKEYDDRINPADGSQRSGGEGRKTQQEAFDQMAAQLKGSLGEARFAEYSRARDNEYQQLKQLVERTGLQTAVAASVFDLRETTSKASVQIFDSKTLSTDEKLQALQALANRTRGQIREALGNEAAEAIQPLAHRAKKYRQKHLQTRRTKNREIQQ